MSKRLPGSGSLWFVSGEVELAPTLDDRCYPDPGTRGNIHHGHQHGDEQDRQDRENNKSHGERFLSSGLVYRCRRISSIVKGYEFRRGLFGGFVQRDKTIRRLDDQAIRQLGDQGIGDKG